MSAEGQTAHGGVERESTVDGPPSESLSEQYSLAKILGIWAAAALLGDTLALSYPSRRYRSALIGIIVHSSQSVLVLVLLLTLVLK